MDALNKAMKEQKLYVLTEEILKDLIKVQARDLYKSQSKGLMTYDQARDVLQCSESAFKGLLADPDTCLRKSKLRGRVSTASVYEEVERLCNPADL